MLDEFLRSRCARAGAVKVKDLLAAFREALPPQQRSRWTRGRLMVELANAGFAIGEVDGIATVAGLSLPIAYTVENGRLVKDGRCS